MKPRMKKRNRRRGATAVEFAIVAPVFFMTVFTCIEFTRLSMIRNMVQEASYFAARDAMVPGATEAECKASAERILSRLGGKSTRVIINDGNGLDDQSDTVSVTVSVPLSDSLLFFPFATEGMAISSKTTMKTERYSGQLDTN